MAELAWPAHPTDRSAGQTVAVVRAVQVRMPEWLQRPDETVALPLQAIEEAKRRQAETVPEPIGACPRAGARTGFACTRSCCGDTVGVRRTEFGTGLMAPRAACPGAYAEAARTYLE